MGDCDLPVRVEHGEALALVQAQDGDVALAEAFVVVEQVPCQARNILRSRTIVNTMDYCTQLSVGLSVGRNRGKATRMRPQAAAAARHAMAQVGR